MQKNLSVATKSKTTPQSVFSSNNTIIFLCVCFVLTAIAAWNAFSIIQSDDIYDWDEARHGMNAYEMIQNNHYIVHTYLGDTDYWNAKPPLSMWQIVLSYRIFGYNLMGLRFFSSLYLPITVIVSMWFMYRKIGMCASIAAGTLLAFGGIRFYHLFHTGDPDALFFFLCLLGCLTLYLSVANSPKWLIPCGICTALAFLTKSMHVVSLLSVIGVVCFYEAWKCKSLRIRDIMIYYVPPCIVPVFIWAVVRYQYDGMLFFEAMLFTDVVERISTAAENTSRLPLHYVIVLHNMVGGAFFWGAFLLIAAWICLSLTVPVKSRAKNDWVFIRVFSLMFLFPLVIFSFSSTVLGWYIYPCLIGFFFLTAYAVDQLWIHGLRRKASIAYRLVSALCATPLLIGIVIMQIRGNLDIGVEGIGKTERSIYQLSSAPAAFQEYLVINCDGNPINRTADDPFANAFVAQQSWLLQSIFDGQIWREGGLDTYGELVDGAVIVCIANNEELIQFAQENPQLQLIHATDDYALFQ